MMHLIWGGVKLISEIQNKPLRHVGTTGNPGMARMRKLPVVQSSCRWANHNASRDPHGEEPRSLARRLEP